MGEDWARQAGGQIRIGQSRTRVRRGGSFGMRSVEWDPEVARGRAKSEDASSNGLFLVARPAFELLFASRGGFLRRMGFVPD